MASNFPSTHESFTTVTRDVELCINRLERLLDWLLLLRENVANLNLDLYSTFHPLISLQHESAQAIQSGNKTTCPLHPDCNKITDLVTSNLNKISE